MGVCETTRRGRVTKDGDQNQIANCTWAQPVLPCFGRLARGKVMFVTVLREECTTRVEVE